MITLSTIDVVELDDKIASGLANDHATRFFRAHQGRIEAIVRAADFFPEADWDFDTL